MDDRATTGKGLAGRKVGIGLAVALVLAAWLVWWQWRPLRGWVCAGTAVATPIAEPQPAPASPAELPEEEDPLAEVRRQWIALLGRQPSWPDAEQACERIDQDFAAVCRGLQPGLATGGSPEPQAECAAWVELIESLGARPPVASSELLSYERVLSNIFHISRVLGGKRTLALREAVEQEDARAEPLAATLYAWLVNRSRCAGRAGTRWQQGPLYDYASFFLQTIGGQAYLRRRSPRVEALTTFYALQVLDDADRRGYNPHGVDPRANIRRARGLLESETLLFSERYQQTLEEMLARWDSRAAAQRAR